jgi:hypothetical protein
MCRRCHPFQVWTQQRQLTTELAGWMGSSGSSTSRTELVAAEEFQRARRCVHAAKSRMKRQHDSKGVASHLYEKGDLVWFNVRNIGLRHTSRRHKLLPKYLGPMRVLDIVGKNPVKSDMPAQLKRVHPVVSTQLVKPCKQRAGGEVPPVLMDGELEYELDDIINHSIHKARRSTERVIVEFCVMWKGPCADSWREPIDFILN